jgi:hypothetical protein
MERKKKQSEAERLRAEWKRVRNRLGEFPDHFFPDKTIEMLDLCTSSAYLQVLVPYVSLGRLCLSRNPLSKHYTDDCPCMYYYNSLYTISNYDNTEKHHFEEADRAIEFVERNIPMKSKEV